MSDLQTIVDETYLACEGDRERIRAVLHERCITDPSFLPLCLEYTWMHGLVELVVNTDKHANKLAHDAAIARGERPTSGAYMQTAPKSQWAELEAKHRAAKVAALRDELGKKGTTP
jgi:hypothetical protein